MGFDKRILILQLVRREDFEVHTLIKAHAARAFKLLHPFFGVSQPDRPCDVVVHGVIDLFTEVSVKLRRIALHVHDRPRGREGRHIACGMPGRACSKFVFLKKNAIGPSGLAQMIECGRADHSATNDDHARLCRHLGHDCPPTSMHLHL